jgi:hypothetical protein
VHFDFRGNPELGERSDADEQVALKQVLAACPHLQATAGHVGTFAEILTGLHGQNLDAWLAAVDADE